MQRACSSWDPVHDCGTGLFVAANVLSPDAHTSTRVPGKKMKEDVDMLVGNKGLNSREVLTLRLPRDGQYSQEVGKYAVAFREVLYQTAINESDFLFIDNHFQVLEMAYLGEAEDRHSYG